MLFTFWYKNGIPPTILRKGSNNDSVDTVYPLISLVLLTLAEMLTSSALPLNPTRLPFLV